MSPSEYSIGGQRTDLISVAGRFSYAHYFSFIGFRTTALFRLWAPVVTTPTLAIKIKTSRCKPAGRLVIVLPLINATAPNPSKRTVRGRVLLGVTFKQDRAAPKRAPCRLRVGSVIAVTTFYVADLGPNAIPVVRN